nr:reverse transcriptase domain-containing protein [Tanacetum cinerariifolium]
AETRAKLKESRTPLVGFSDKVSYPIGTINLNVTMGESERIQTIPMEFAVVKIHSPYNVILGRTGLRIVGAVVCTIHSMIKFSTANRIAIVTTKKETLHECRKMEEAQGPTLEGRITFSRIQLPDSEGTTNMGREESQGQTKEEGEPKDTVQPPPNSPKKDIPIDEEIEGNDEHPERPVETKPSKKVVIHDDYPNQTVTIGGNLHNQNYRFIAEHELKTYPHIEPRVQRKRSIAPDKIKVVKEEVEEWLKAEIVRKVKERSRKGQNRIKTGQKREAWRSREKSKAVAVDRARKNEENKKRMNKNAYTGRKLFKFKETRKDKCLYCKLKKVSSSGAFSAQVLKLYHKGRPM